MNRITRIHPELIPSMKWAEYHPGSPTWLILHMTKFRSRAFLTISFSWGETTVETTPAVVEGVATNLPLQPGSLTNNTACESYSSSGMAMSSRHRVWLQLPPRKTSLGRMSFWWRCCSSSALPCSQPTDRAHNGCIGTINSLLRTHTHRQYCSDAIASNNGAVKKYTHWSTDETMEIPRVFIPWQHRTFHD